MRLLIMRHGQAVSGSGGADAERWLTVSGREESRLAGEAAAARGYRPDHIYASPLVRAVQTAELVAHAIGLAGPIRVHRPLAPGGSPAQALSVLDAHEDDATILLVSHEPTVRAMATLASGKDPFPAFSTAAIAAIARGARGGRLLERYEPSHGAWITA